MKVCSKCRVEKEVSLFTKDSSKQDGLWAVDNLKKGAKWNG